MKIMWYLFYFITFFIFILFKIVYYGVDNNEEITFWYNLEIINFVLRLPLEIVCIDEIANSKLNILMLTKYDSSIGFNKFFPLRFNI